MSALLLFGFLGVRDGRHTSITKKNRDGKDVQSFYTVYSTCVQCQHNEAGAPAELRLWSSSSAVILPDDTIVFVIAKLFAPTNGPFLLECIYVGNFPGDPDDSSYADVVPEVDAGPFVVVVGQVIKVPDIRSSPLKTF